MADAYWLGPREVISVERESSRDSPVLMSGLAIAEPTDRKSYGTIYADMRSGSKGTQESGDSLTGAQFELIDNLIYAIYELRKQGKKLTTPDDILQEMLRQKTFSSRAGWTFTELIVEAARKKFVLYVKKNNGLYIHKFKYEAADFEDLLD
ncbi:hypothetical protein QFC19_003930 [Naganishia cerealis]|uniref:Uncharacterized protein n=1 Tax=Naganishia cerealis TaxID=610337 RepID=A0ACC2W0M9_9TREE|nr:hypothetical protein QFC19_003930 [Naganishia cerealis]